MLYKRHPQLDRQGGLLHLLSIEGLPKAVLDRLLAMALDEEDPPPSLQGGRVFLWFDEPSTHGRASFEAAARRLSAEVIDVAPSSASLLDTVAGLDAKAGDMLVLRHPEPGVPVLVAAHLPPQVHLVNAGDGAHEDPTRGLRELCTLRRHTPGFADLTVAIVGDLLHSGAARSLVHGLTTLGTAEVRAIGPKTLVPADMAHLGVRIFHSIDEGLRDCDVVVGVPMSEASVAEALLPSAREFLGCYGLTRERLGSAKPDAIVIGADPAALGAGQRSIGAQPDLDIAVCKAVLRSLAGEVA